MFDQYFIQIITALASVIIAFVAIILSIVAIYADRRNQQSTLQWDEFETYEKIWEKKIEAETSRDKKKCEDYYREVIDLLWAQFYLWNEGYFSDEMMFIWQSTRRKLWQDNNCIEIDEGSPVFYRNEWQKLKDTFFLGENDPFVAFIDDIHSNDDIKYVLQKHKIKYFFWKINCKLYKLRLTISILYNNYLCKC